MSKSNFPVLSSNWGRCTMAPRLELQSLLEEVTDHVYFQPPANVQMKYPCIIYSRDGTSTDHANNGLYRHAKRYQITVVDRNPDTELADKVAALRYTSFYRSFAADDLNHSVFSLFFQKRSPSASKVLQWAESCDRLCRTGVDHFVLYQ